MHRSQPPARPLDPDEVERIIVASIATQPEGAYGEMERIRQASASRNERDHLHAVLIYQSGWFVHWVEGPGDALRTLMEHVAKDARHRDSQRLHHSRGKRYLPTRWSMMMDPSNEPASRFGARVMALRQMRERGFQYSPTSVIRRLCAPLRLSAGDDPVQAESFHRVGVVSADDGRSFELVRWLGQRKKVDGHSRRVAGESDLDSGSDYVEFMEDEQPVRVIACSRTSLQHGMRRAFLPDWRHLVLLFGDDARRNTQLMERVIEACAGLPVTPHLLGAAPDEATHARMTVNAHAAGLRYGQLGMMSPQDHDDLWHATREWLRRAGAPPNSQWDLTHPSWVA
jgi:hypothetical protein